MIRPRNAILLSLRNAHLRLDNVGLTTKEGLALGGALTKNAFVKSLDVSSNRLFNEAFVGIEAGGLVSGVEDGVFDPVGGTFSAPAFWTGGLTGTGFSGDPPVPAPGLLSP